MVAITIKSDITVEGRWITSPSSLLFYYATGNLTSNTSLILSNACEYIAEFEIPASEAYEVSPRSGTLKPNESITFEIMAYMTLSTLPALVINSVEENTATCFAYLALNVLKQVAGKRIKAKLDCQVSDYYPVISECNGLTYSVAYYWSNEMCFGGLSLPSDTKLSCSNKRVKN